MSPKQEQRVFDQSFDIFTISVEEELQKIHHTPSANSFTTATEANWRNREA
jgi:hypothetical protein